MNMNARMDRKSEAKADATSGKKNVCVIFGGQSSEHDVSLVSASNVMASIDPERYNVYPVGISRNGQWFLYTGPVEKVRNSTWQDDASFCQAAFIAPDAAIHGLVVLTGSPGHPVQQIRLDCVFPVLHGKFGEDGTIQGLFELARIPYVGCGVTASANAMDKVFSRTIFDAEGIPQARWTWSGIKAWRQSPESELARIEQAFAYPVFVKPANAGSSIGVSKAKNRDALAAALNLAFEHDTKAVIEEFIDGREIEVAVLDGEPAVASCCGEVIAANEFYDYEAKYHNAASRTVLPADLPAEASETIRKYALKAFSALGCAGLSRVDFFITRQDGRVLLNEINTLPGFTEISMYPKLMENSGVAAIALVTHLIELAISQMPA